MLQLNFLELEFTSSIFSESKPLYAFYKKDNKDYVTELLHPSDSNVAFNKSVNFEYLIAFLNYDIAPLRNFLYELIQMINTYFTAPSKEIDTEKFNKTKKAVCVELKNLHPCFSMYSQYYISYILINNYLSHFHLKTRHNLYEVIETIVNLVFTGCIQNADFHLHSTTTTLSESFTVLEKNLRNDISHFLSATSIKDNLDLLTEKIFTCCKSTLVYHLAGCLNETHESVFKKKFYEIIPELSPKSKKDDAINELCEKICSIYKKYCDQYLTDNANEHYGTDLENELSKVISTYFSDSNLKKSTELIYKFCAKYLEQIRNTYQPKQIEFSYIDNPIVMELKNSIKNCCKSHHSSLIEDNTYNELIADIKEIIRKIIPFQAETSLSFYYESPEFLNPLIKRFDHFFSLHFPVYHNHQDNTDFWSLTVNDTTAHKTDDLCDDPLYFLEQFRNDIVVRMPDCKFNIMNNLWYFYIDYLYSQYGCCYRLPQKYPIFQNLLPYFSLQNKELPISAFPGTPLLMNSINNQLLTNDLKRTVGSIGVPLNDQKARTDFFQDTLSGYKLFGEELFFQKSLSYIINSFSQYILSDLDALLSFNAFLWLHPDGSVSLSNKKNIIEKNGYYQSYQNKLRYMKSHYDNHTSPSIQIEEEYQHKKIYRYVLYNKVSLEDYNKILSLPDYKPNKLLFLLSHFNLDYKLLLNYAKE